MQNQFKTMQKRAKFAIEYSPIGLDEAFPICVSEPFEQHDLPIRYLHFHDCLELGLCSEGNGIFVIGDRVLPFGAGDVSFIAANEVHLARSAPGTISRWTWIYLDVSRLVPAAPIVNWGTILTEAQHPRLCHLVAQMIEEAHGEYSNRSDMTRALVWQLSLEMARIAPQSPTGKPFSRPDYDRISPALAQLASRFSHGEATRISVAELAQNCHMSEAHFRRVFKSTMGRTPREYAFDLQMRLAASLLRGTSKSVLSIAQDCGFESLSSFNRVFKRSFGKAPRNWRRELSAHEAAL